MKKITKQEIKTMVEKLLSGNYDPETFSYDFPVVMMELDDEELFGDDHGDICYVCSMYDEHIDPNDPIMKDMYDKKRFIRFFGDVYQKYLVN